MICNRGDKMHMCIFLYGAIQCKEEVRNYVAMIHYQKRMSKMKTSYLDSYVLFWLGVWNTINLGFLIDEAN